MTETIFTNARVVTADREFSGTVAVRSGCVVAVDERGGAAPSAIDLGGDYLMPGFVELHTDNLEKHFSPRPGVKWPGAAAVVAHDAQIAASGITTVFDALSLGDVVDGSARIHGLEYMRDGISAASAANVLKAEHFLHLRCELSYGGVLDLFRPLMDAPEVRLVSLMDHTPGQRQFTDVDKYRFFYQKKFGMSDEAFERFLADRCADHDRFSATHRRAIVGLAQERGLILASHDDATIEHVEEAAGDRMSIAEFPTTIEAARESRQRGLAVLMGGPNIMLGGSHSGNIAASDLAAKGLLDIVSSDYVPSCLVHTPFVLADAGIGFDLAAATRLISLNPARAAGFKDRGEIAPGQRADLVRVKRVDGMPVVRSVWREGQRII